ncbi:MAG TPA: hypothetical protein GX697_02705 [Firmicutes bacterium]|nr:hypothetical protein [Bacillota bacterium]
MKRKTLFMGFWLVAALFLFPGGNSSWRQSLQVEGHVATAPAPAGTPADTEKEELQDPAGKAMDGSDEEGQFGAEGLLEGSKRPGVEVLPEEPAAGAGKEQKTGTENTDSGKEQEGQPGGESQPDGESPPGEGEPPAVTETEGETGEDSFSTEGSPQEAGAGAENE